MSDKKSSERKPYTQQDIISQVDITSATKHFSLNLEKFGPYKVNYTRNGRHLLLAGEKGHLAAFDWQTKKLHCEINCLQTIRDAKWLHQETLFAVAQKNWTYIYDNQGIEIHCLKMLDQVLQLQFLPHHFLLCSSNSKSFISWLDVSIGRQVAGFTTGLGSLGVMTQNPQNAVILLGHSNGSVTFWSPNNQKPLVKMLCHPSKIISLFVHKNGRTLTTSSSDKTIKLWDLRTYKLMKTFPLPSSPSSISVSHKSHLALSFSSVVQVYPDPQNSTISSENCLFQHQLPQPGSVDLQFCPYEDVLAVGHYQGFTSLLAPGSAEVTFDALEVNPFQTKDQRREAEVLMLLDKVQPELINLDTDVLGKVNIPSLKEQMEQKSKKKFLKQKKIEFEPKFKMKGRSKVGNKEKRKQAVWSENKMNFIRKTKKNEKIKKISKEEKKINVLDRFKK